MRTFRALLASVLCLLVGGCEEPDASADKTLPVYFTCDTQGRLEPCGCFKGQFGGLTRLKTVLDAEAPDDSLMLDVGDSIGGAEDYDVIQYRYMLKAFADMNYAAINVGHREGRLSLEQLRALGKESPVPIISANLLDQSTGKPVLQPFKIVERRGLRIAIVGLVQPEGLAEHLGEGLALAEMATTLGRLLPRLRAESDTIILLAFADEEAMGRLAEQFYEARIILGGRVKQPAQEVKRVNRSILYFVTNEARAVGILNLGIRPDGNVSVDANQVLFLHDRITEDPSFVALAQEYRQEIRRTRLEVDDPSVLAADAVPGVRTAAEFVGSATCLECHPAAAAVWSASGHARAFATLERRNADADPKCIGCHTTGFGAPTGYQRTRRDRLVDVGCESCHGPGGLHVKAQSGEPGVEFRFRPLGAGDCLNCHHGEFSRPFQWDEFWPPVKHGKEQVTAKNP
jgi:hypothetical protein